jgi:hypothetical protein
MALTALAAQVPDNWQKVTTEDGSLSVSVPGEWLVSDPNDPTFQAEYEKVRANNPEWAKKMSEKPVGAALVVYDMDAISTGKMGVLNVIKSKGNGLTTKMYGDVAKEIAKGLPLKGKLNHKILDLPVGKSLSYWGTLEIAVESGSKRELDLLAYLFLKNEDLYILQFMCDGNDLKTKRETFEKVAKSAKA